MTIIYTLNHFAVKLLIFYKDISYLINPKVALNYKLTLHRNKIVKKYIKKHIFVMVQIQNNVKINTTRKKYHSREAWLVT